MLTKVEKSVIESFLESEWGSEEMQEALGELIRLFDANNIRNPR